MPEFFLIETARIRVESKQIHRKTGCTIMGREVRRVPKDWQHPHDSEGRLQPLSLGFKEYVEEWNQAAVLWANGEHPDQIESSAAERVLYGEMAFAEWDPRPNPQDFMPDWPESERTHYQMYETVTEGTPVSPVMNSPEELARWLVVNEHHCSATYEQWLRVCNGGFAPSGVIDTATGRVQNGVAGLSPDPEPIPEEFILLAARAAHEVNRTYCLALGDASQLAWDDAPQWQRDASIAGVRFQIRHDYENGRSRDPRESASVSHEAWLAEKVALGWIYGPVKNPDTRQHPGLVPYWELPFVEQVKDMLFVATVRGVLARYMEEAR